MRLILLSLALLTLGAGCGEANDVTNLITSTPNAAALQVAEANTQSAATAVAGYFTVNGSYAGITTDAVRRLDPGLSSTVTVVATATGYCVQAVVDGQTASLRGPGGSPAAGPC